jgi:hypothetical protein
VAPPGVAGPDAEKASGMGSGSRPVPIIYEWSCGIGSVILADIMGHARIDTVRIYTRSSERGVTS